MFILVVSAAANLEVSAACSRQLTFLTPFGSCRWSKWLHVLSASGPAVVVELGNSEESIIQNINLNLANAVRLT
jgi:hypothetical protein